MHNILNKKGQALIEFLIILPMFLLIVMGIFDFGNILYQKYKLENSVDYIVDLYRDGKEEDLEAYLDNNGIDMYTRFGDDYNTIELLKTVDVITPGLDLILGDTHKIRTTKVIYEGHYE